ncbi:hypothetical protein CR513_24656, partial [Mucuna pruriens]
MPIEHQISRLKVFGDSALVIYQLRKEWVTQDAKLVPYHAHIMALKEHFDEISFHYVPQDENQMADALATLEYLKRGVYPPEAIENDKRILKRLATGFLLSGVILYKRSIDSTLLRCVDDCKAREIMEEVHEGAFGTHANGHALVHKILRSKMESDCCQHVKRWMKCQMYADNIHMAPSALHNLTSS